MPQTHAKDLIDELTRLTYAPMLSHRGRSTACGSSTPCTSEAIKVRGGWGNLRAGARALVYLDDAERAVIVDGEVEMGGPSRDVAGCKPPKLGGTFAVEGDAEPVGRHDPRGTRDDAACVGNSDASA